MSVFSNDVDTELEDLSDRIDILVEYLSDARNARNANVFFNALQGAYEEASSAAATIQDIKRMAEDEEDEIEDEDDEEDEE